MFTTLGGMLLPSLLGIAFYNEGITVAKIVSVLLIILALAVTVKKGESKSGTIYYAAIFVLNGFFGVISKIYQSAPFDRVDEAAYMMITGAWSFAISLVLLFIVTGKGQAVQTGRCVGARDAWVRHDELFGQPDKPDVACRDTGVGVLSGSDGGHNCRLHADELFHEEEAVPPRACRGRAVDPRYRRDADNKGIRYDMTKGGHKCFTDTSGFCSADAGTVFSLRTRLTASAVRRRISAVRPVHGFRDQ